jgi:flagellar assembly protein FliH
MLLKASEIKYQELAVDGHSDDEYDLEEDYLFDEDEDDGEVMHGRTLVLGGLESRFLEDGEELVFEEEAIDSSFEFDEDSGVFIGKTVVIGGQDALLEEEEVFEEYYDEPDSDMDDIESLLDDEIIETDIEQEVEVKKISVEESLVDDFSNAVSSLEQSLEMGMPDWRTVTIHPSADTSANVVIENYKSAREVDFSTHDFISEDERDNLLAEAAQLISQAQDFNAMSMILKDLEENVKRNIEGNANLVRDEIATEKQEVRQEIEAHIDEVISKQRESIQREAEEHIEKTVQFYKEKMGEDEQLLIAANNISSRREQILDEAYSRSLKLIEEAEEQANRIIEDAHSANQEAERIKEDAKLEGQRIEQRFHEDGERIISDANIESSKIIQAAEEQHQEIVEAATQDGFNVGYQEGREEAIKENAQLLMDTTNALNELHAAFPAAVKENEGKLIKIAIRVADTLLKEETIAKPELCVKILDRAIRRVSDLERVLIKVNPLDLDLILPKEAHFRGILPDVQDFVITGHYAIPRGGCLIETNSGTIDGQFHSQLKIVEDLFNQIRSEYDETDEEEATEESAEE